MDTFAAVVAAWHDSDHQPIQEEVGYSGSSDAAGEVLEWHDPILVPAPVAVVDVVGFVWVVGDCQPAFHVAVAPARS